MSPPLPPVNLATYLDSPLDTIANVYAAHGASRLVGNYRGPIYTIRRASDAATMDVFAPFSSKYGWPLSAPIVTWAAGSQVTVTTVYDQTGNSRSLVQATVASQPMLNLDGAHPVFDFDGYASSLDGTAGLAAIAQNAGGVSAIMVRQHHAARVGDYPPIYATGGTALTRLFLGPNATTGKDSISARRLDADSVARSTGFALATDWAVQIGRWDYTAGVMRHYLAGQTETGSVGAGSTSDTASTFVYVGAASATLGLSHWQGRLAAVIWVARSLSDAEVTRAAAALTNVPVLSTRPYQFLKWGAAQLTGATYTLAPGKTDYTLLTPTGATPIAGDLATHRYHHHTQTIDYAGRQWVAFSSALNNEDATGQLSVVMSSTDGGSTWTAPVAAVPSQETMDDTITSTGRQCQPNSFQVYGGNLYLITAVLNGFNSIGHAMLATLCNSDGSVGTPFLIANLVSYIPRSTFPTYTYDATLGPPLLALANLTGTWGGSQPGQPDVGFQGWTSQGGSAETFAEPMTVPMDDTGLNLARYWRRIGGTNRIQYWWSQLSADGGQTWTSLAPSDIPNNPSAGAVMRLPDGRVALVTNAQGVKRDPLVLALFNGTTGALQSVYAVRQGLTADPVYAGTNKSAGAQYPGISFDGTNLWVSYSVAKENVAVSKIPLAGL